MNTSRFVATKQKLKKSACAAVVFLLGVILVECGISIYYRTASGGRRYVPVDNSPFVFAVKPNTSNIERGIEYASNNYGMRRQTDVTEEPRADTTRILSYGDSIAFGWGVKFEQTYPHLLETELNDGTGRRFEVLNMFRGAAPTIASFHIRHDVPRLKPTGIVIEIELLNDTSDEAMILADGCDEDGLPTNVHRARYILSWDGQLLSSLTSSGSYLERTMTWSLVSRAVGKFWSRAAESPLSAQVPQRYYYNFAWERYRLTHDALPAGLDRMFDSLSGIHRFAQRNDVRFLLVIVPSKYSFSHPRYRDSSLDQIRDAEARARALNIPFISVYEAMEKAGGADLFMDFCHPTDEGNEVIARELYPILSQW